MGRDPAILPIVSERTSNCYQDPALTRRDTRVERLKSSRTNGVKHVKWIPTSPASPCVNLFLQSVSACTPGDGWSGAVGQHHRTGARRERQHPSRRNGDGTESRPTSSAATEHHGRT